MLPSSLSCFFQRSFQRKVARHIPSELVALAIPEITTHHMLLEITFWCLIFHVKYSTENLGANTVLFLHKMLIAGKIWLDAQIIALQRAQYIC